MTKSRPKLRVFLDEGVPVEVGRVFERHGHEVVPFDGTLKRGSPDELVCAVAQANDAVLIAYDKDMKALAKRHGVGRHRFKRLSLIRFTCPEPDAAARLEQAMSLVEHEWELSTDNTARRLFIEIGKDVLRTYR